MRTEAQKLILGAQRGLHAAGRVPTLPPPKPRTHAAPTGRRSDCNLRKHLNFPGCGWLPSGPVGFESEAEIREWIAALRTVSTTTDVAATGLKAEVPAAQCSPRPPDSSRDRRAPPRLRRHKRAGCGVGRRPRQVGAAETCGAAVARPGGAAVQVQTDPSCCGWLLKRSDGAITWCGDPASSPTPVLARRSPRLKPWLPLAAARRLLAAGGRSGGSSCRART